jgi:hypothetical protein
LRIVPSRIGCIGAHRVHRRIGRIGCIGAHRTHRRIDASGASARSARTERIDASGASAASARTQRIDMSAHAVVANAEARHRLARRALALPFDPRAGIAIARRRCDARDHCVTRQGRAADLFDTDIVVRARAHRGRAATAGRTLVLTNTRLTRLTFEARPPELEPRTSRVARTASLIDVHAALVSFEHRLVRTALVRGGTS